MNLALRRSAALSMLTLVAACGTDVASRGRTETGGENTGTSDTTLDTGGSGDTGTVEPVCGDGIIDSGESCDDGANNSETGACRDGVDSDGDLRVDCFDPDCHGINAAGTCTEICNDGIDNNTNGQLDCLDTACSSDRWCDEICTDRRDNDGDTLVDCADPECVTIAACIEVCTDGVDNDTDGLSDCRDPSCFANAACIEACTGGSDEDLDGLIDCRDADCRLTATCCVQDPLENNDAIATATPIAAWQACMGTAVTVSTGDDDVYAVPVCAGVSIQASINFGNANGNIDLELRNATGASVLAFSRSLANNSETISYNAVRTETLFLRAIMAGALACSSYTYNFTISGSCP